MFVCVWHKKSSWGSCTAVGGRAVAAFYPSCDMRFLMAESPRRASSPRLFHQLFTHKLEVSLAKLCYHLHAHYDLFSHRVKPWNHVLVANDWIDSNLPSMIL